MSDEENKIIFLENNKNNFRESDFRWCTLYCSDPNNAKCGNEKLLKYFSISPIGKYNDPLQVFITKRKIYLRTDGWRGSPEELLRKTKREDYRLTVQYIVSMAEMVRNGVGDE